MNLINITQLRLIIIRFTLVCFFVIFVSYNCEGENLIKEYDSAVEYTNDSALIDLSIYLKNGKYIIDEIIDLHYRTLYLPRNICIHIRGGGFKNGRIIGDNTSLTCRKRDVVFDHIQIKGSWNISKIRTTMFADLSYENSLKDVLALANPKILNQIHIEKGVYYVTATETSPRCLVIDSNTVIKIDGSIVLNKNNLGSYSILHIIGRDISIYGNGCIVGDKSSHLGTQGEWGMGISIYGGENITVKGLIIKECWGDCIYIRRNSQNVVIKNCTLENGRRQGISIISAQNVLVKNCIIRNIEGTNPAFAIDIEPNKGNVVKSVRIENVIVTNCRGGFESNGYDKDALIEEISIKNCSISNTKIWPMRFRKTERIYIEKCSFNDFNEPQVILLNDIKLADIYRIIIDGKKVKQKNQISNFISSKNVNFLNIK